MNGDEHQAAPQTLEIEGASAEGCPEDAEVTQSSDEATVEATSDDLDRSPAEISTEEGQGGADEDAPGIPGLEALVTAFRAEWEREAVQSRREVAALRQQVDTLVEGREVTTFKPTILKLVALHADLVGAATSARAGGSPDHADDFDHFVASVEGLLEDLELTSVGAEEGVAFDRGLHHAQQSRLTTVPAEDQTIARVLRQGFRKVGEERVLVPARVVVHRYEEGAAPEDASTAGD